MAAPTPSAAAANTYDEDAVIKARLFTAEERLYKRIQKRCATFLPPDLAPEAPSKPAAAAPTAETDKSPPLSEAEKLRLEMEMDFTHFEAAIERVQLLHDANRKEISRYEESKESITRASIKARNDMATFHEDLRIAQETKRHKLVYDEIAREILSQSHLKSRSTQHENIKRLEAEIRELEKEKDDYGKVWAARRKQFDEIVAALTAMQMQIQEDKEEQERREALDEEGSEGEEVERKAGAGGGDDQKGLLAATGVLSGATTPAINMHEANTPAPISVPQDISNADMKDANDTDAAAGAAGAAAVATAITPAPIDESSGAVNNDTAMEDVPTTTADDDEDDGGLESGEHSEREEGQDDESMSSSRGSRRNSGTHSRSRSRSGTRSHTRSRTRSHSRSGSDRQYSDDEGEVTDHKDDSEGYASPQSRRDDDDDRASDRKSYGSRSEGEEDEEEGEERESDGGRRYEDEGSVERTPFSGSGPSSVPPGDSATDGDRTPREDSLDHTPVDTMDTT